jgi:hypothetical protein
MTGIRSPIPGWRSRSIASWALPNWVMAMVLPVPAAPDKIRPRRALMACRFSVSRRPVLTTLPQGRGRGRGQPGVIIQPELVIEQLVGLRHRRPLLAGQQLRRDGLGRGETGQASHARRRRTGAGSPARVIRAGAGEPLARMRRATITPRLWPGRHRAAHSRRARCRALQLWARAGRGEAHQLPCRARRPSDGSRPKERSLTGVGGRGCQAAVSASLLPLTNDHRQLPGGRVAQAIVLAT